MFNTEAIKNLAHSNQTASAVFLFLSQRERSRRILNVTLLKRHLREQKVDISDKEFFLVFKTLEDMEIGNLVYGRKGNADVFVWYYNLKDVSAAALGSNEAPIKAARNEKAPIKKEIKSVKGSDSITITIPLDLLKQFTKL